MASDSTPLPPRVPRVPRLPDELLLMVFGWMRTHTRIAMMDVCEQFARVACDESLGWSDHYKADFGYLAWMHAWQEREGEWAAKYRAENDRVAKKELQRRRAAKNKQAGKSLAARRAPRRDWADSIVSMIKTTNRHPSDTRGFWSCYLNENKAAPLCCHKTCLRRNVKEKGRHNFGEVSWFGEYREVHNIGWR